MIPYALHELAMGSLLLGFACAAVIGLDVFRHPQRMWIMNIVWPTTALFATALAVWGYFEYGRSGASPDDGRARVELPQPAFPASVAKSTTHCGAGCTVGDIMAELLAFFVPTVAVWFGWQTVFEEKIFAVWTLDYVTAFVIGIAFQYFAIQPMRKLSPGRGLLEAVKADALSLTAWQVGMYGFMALAHFYLFGRVLETRLTPAMVEFWFMMQIAMIAGFLTSYPANWLLISSGIKERM